MPLVYLAYQVAPHRKLVQSQALGVKAIRAKMRAKERKYRIPVSRARSTERETACFAALRARGATVTSQRDAIRVEEPIDAHRCVQ